MVSLSKQSVQRLLRHEKGVRTCAYVQCTPLVIPVGKEHSWWHPNHTQNFSAIRPAVFDIRKNGAHVRAHSYTPPITFVKRLTNESLIMYQISAQSVQPFPRYGNGGTSARAHVLMYPTHSLCNMHRCLVSKRTSNLVTTGRAIPELQLSGRFGHPSRRIRYLPGTRVS